MFGERWKWRTAEKVWWIKSAFCSAVRVCPVQRLLWLQARLVDKKCLSRLNLVERSFSYLACWAWDGLSVLTDSFPVRWCFQMLSEKSCVVSPYFTSSAICLLLPRIQFDCWHYATCIFLPFVVIVIVINSIINVSCMILCLLDCQLMDLVILFL